MRKGLVPTTAQALDGHWGRGWVDWEKGLMTESVVFFSKHDILNVLAVHLVNVFPNLNVPH